MNRHFSKEDRKTANKNMKRCSLSLVIRRMQIKIPMRYHFLATRILFINKMLFISPDKCWEYVEGEKLEHHYGERKTVTGAAAVEKQFGCSLYVFVYMEFHST